MARPLKSVFRREIIRRSFSGNVNVIGFINSNGVAEISGAIYCEGSRPTEKGRIEKLAAVGTQ